MKADARRSTTSVFNELRIMNGQEGRNRGNFIGPRGGAGARGSCKNFVREECKQCPVRAAQLVFARERIPPSSFLLFFFFPPATPRALHAQVSFSLCKFAPTQSASPPLGGRRWMPAGGFWLSFLRAGKPHSAPNVNYTLINRPRQFVSRAQSVRLNFTVLYRVALTFPAT